jgi:hypothetical protein
MTMTIEDLIAQLRGSKSVRPHLWAIDKDGRPCDVYLVLGPDMEETIDALATLAVKLAIESS